MAHELCGQQSLVQDRLLAGLHKHLLQAELQTLTTKRASRAPYKPCRA